MAKKKLTEEQVEIWNRLKYRPGINESYLEYLTDMLKRDLKPQDYSVILEEYTRTVDEVNRERKAENKRIIR